MKKVRSLAIASLFVIAAVRGGAETIVEKFTADPLQNGWQIFGDTNLFAWDSTNQNLAVTWDSSQTNSYFYLPLGKTLTTNDSFLIQFDLNLTDATAGGYGSELAIGLLHFSDATNLDFSRGGGSSPNLFEFDYFPDTGFGDSIDATLKDSQPGFDGFYFAYDNLSLNPAVTYRVLLAHDANSTAIRGQIFADGQLYTSLTNVYSSGGIENFFLDAISISSYQDDGFGDSVLAHGTVDNFVFASPLPVEKISTLAAGQIQFASDTNWLYTLEQNSDLQNPQNWSPAATPTFGNGANLILQSTNAPADKAFYRVRAELPLP